MADSLSSLSGLGTESSIDQLVSMYMAIERRPVDALKAKKDELKVQSAVFTDLRAKLDGLRDLAEELSAFPSTIFTAHTSTSSNDKLVTALAGSSASNGTFVLEDIVLATAHRVQSAAVAAGWTTGEASSFSINGSLITVSAGATLSQVKDAINSASYDTDRGVNASVVAGRLVLDARTPGSGHAVSVADVDGSVLKDVGLATTPTDPIATDLTPWEGGADPASWVRTFDLGSDQTVSRFQWSRDATGSATDKTPSDYQLEYWDAATSSWKTLKSVTGNAMQADHLKDDTFFPVTTGQIRMTVTATNDGAPPAMDGVKIFGSGSFDQTVLRDAANGHLTVNGIGPITLTKNSGVTDVIEGLTLDLKGSGDPAESVTITVANDTTSMRSKVDSFLEKLNSLTGYLALKTSVTDNGAGVYTRGALNGNYLYSSLRTQLIGDLSRSVESGVVGAPTRLNELGIELDSDMKFVVKDSTKLNSALEKSLGGVQSFFTGTTGLATRVLTRLKPYLTPPSLESKAYLDQDEAAITLEHKSLDGQIKSLNERLAIRENVLRQQFTRLQAMMIEASQLQQRMASIFSYSSGWGY